MVSPQDPSHRIIELFVLKGTFKAHLVQHPCSEQGRLQLKHVAQTPVQPNLGHLPPLWASCSSFFQPLMIHSSGSSEPEVMVFYLTGPHEFSFYEVFLLVEPM